MDREIVIATADSHSSKQWINRETGWHEFVSSLRETHRTEETVAEFCEMEPEKKNQIKNCRGGFVGGALHQKGPRNRKNIKYRSLLTLDADFCKTDIEDAVKKLGCTCCIYSTHSHRKGYERYRVIILLDRDIEPEKYEPLSRMVASKIGIEMFDTTTHQCQRLMYYPSTPKDGEYYFREIEGSPLDTEAVLGEYSRGWEDTESWPRSSRETKPVGTNLREQKDPLKKPGIIGAFCRAYPITKAIEEFLSDVYAPEADGDRYTYIKGSTAGGVIIYDDRFSYSHHSTDPASCILCNSFDLVRVHKFGSLDDGFSSGRSENEKPSFRAMAEFAGKISRVRDQMEKDKLEEARQEFCSPGMSSERQIIIMPLQKSLTEEPIKIYDFLINRLIYDNGVNLISGDPKTYKTFIAIDIALGVAAGTEALGHRVLKDGSVLFISTEFDVRDRFLKLAEGKGIDKSVLDRIIVFLYDSIDTFQWNKDKELLERVIKQYRPRLVVLDPLTYIFDGDINKNDEVGHFFKELKLMIRKYELSVLLVHHNNRMSEVKRINNVSGSSAITRFADSIIYLEKLKEDEEQDISKTDEELDKEEKNIKLIKGPYRHGREGYKYYLLGFKNLGDRTEIGAVRYDTAKEFSTKLTPAARADDINNQIISALYDRKLNCEGFKFKDVITVVENRNGNSERYFKERVKEVLAKMVEDKLLKKEGYTFIYEGL